MFDPKGWGGGTSIPLVYCDTCKEPITKMKDGLVAYKANGGEDGRVWFAHRSYAKKGCDVYRGWPWMDLDDFLTYVIRNLGDPKWSGLGLTTDDHLAGVTE